MLYSFFALRRFYPLGKGNRLRLSLGTKIVLLLITFGLLLSGIGIAVSYRAIERMNNNHYLGKADDVAAIVSHAVDPHSAKTFRDEALAIYNSTDQHVLSDAWGEPQFDEYVNRYDALYQTNEYKQLLSELSKLQDGIEVNCLYINIVIPQDKVCMYLVDAATEDACPIGCLDPLYEINYEIIDDPTRGFPAYITDTPEYGWLVSSTAPVYDENGEVVCYACVDISMDAVKQQEATYFWALTAGLFGLTFALCIVTSIYVRRFVTRPLNTLSQAASRYCNPEEGERSSFKSLDIHTKDEIETLHTSMVQMEHDMDSYIDNLVETRAQLIDTQKQASQMDAIAHRDALTGIRNRFAYDQEIRRLDEQLAEGRSDFGIAIVDLNDLKIINDSYGHECGDESLVQLSNLICSVFVHSPVFRIGGDEFAIILRNNDYENIGTLKAEFENNLLELRVSRDLEPWERISAAFGYALCDPAIDANTESVFRRADMDMYEHKKRMKGSGAVRNKPTTRG